MKSLEKIEYEWRISESEIMKPKVNFLMTSL